MIFFQIRLTGAGHFPKGAGPLLIVSNHLSEWDPPFLGSSLPCQVHWLAKIELFELLGGWMSPFFHLIHCVPVDREKADLGAIKEVVRLLKAGRKVAVFAEGGIRTDETSLLGDKPQLKEGAAAIAILSGAPILPVLLTGTLAAYDWRNWRLFRRRTLEIVIGPVFHLSSRGRTEATAEILRRLLELKPRLERPRIC